MILFEGLAEQAAELAQRVRGGSRVTLADEGGTRWLLDETARQLGGEAVVVKVPRELDKAAYVMLSAAAQCGAQTLEQTAATLASHQADPAPALDILAKALGKRPLLVDDLDAFRTATPDSELRDVFAPSLQHVDTWIKDRAAVVVQGDVEGAVRPCLKDPRPGQGWDATLLWARASQNVDRYILALSRARLLGEAEDTSIGWDIASIAGELWRSMNQELRELVALLAVHGRPVEQMLFEGLGLVPAAVVEMGIEAFLVERSSCGTIRLATPSVWRDLISPAGVRERHRRLGRAFASVARAGNSEVVTPLAVLEAHRHYAEVPDVERAQEFARFGVEMLLSTAKRLSIEGREIHESYVRAGRTYDVVMKLDEQIRAGGSSAGIGSRARAYAVHYRAYNRYKGNEDSPTETLAAYREALSIWPQNALFWSRTIGCCFVAGRYEEGVRARDEAFDRVPMHHKRAIFLVARTVEHLLRREMPLAALLVWRDHRAGTLMEQRVERTLLDRLTCGWDETRLWAPGLEPLLLRKPVHVQIDVRAPRMVLCKLLGRWGVGDSPAMALMIAVSELFKEITALVEDPTADPELAARRCEIVEHLDIDALATAKEPLRWIAYLASLNDRIARGELSEAQRTMLLSTWQRARQIFPRLRRPSLGLTDDGRLHVSWKFADQVGLTFTIDIERDGRVDWFYRNTSDARICGTEDEPEAELSEETLCLLSPFEL